LSPPASAFLLDRLWRNIITAMARTASTAATDPTAIPAFAPAESELPLLVAPAPVPVPVAVAAALPVDLDPAAPADDGDDEEERPDDVEDALVALADVTA
jgi:hypothetical protein